MLSLGLRGRRCGSVGGGVPKEVVGVLLIILQERFVLVHDGLQDLELVVTLKELGGVVVLVLHVDDQVRGGVQTGLPVVADQDLQDVFGLSLPVKSALCRADDPGVGVDVEQGLRVPRRDGEGQFGL